ncbi:hypothetical protein [Halobiforma nitratireducens]|uniref:Lipoprotein n=1 Tax=Halobiforma nitratireducens JCM 10879 TaxID=1227454 RepID=M0MPQ3_9EURY|nr:hypothetical protein [Halobiforma nitratireducens]EMA46440.1 hypothetical protein C446_01183 [Halobiforma nitratireducens JCM 10879]
MPSKRETLLTGSVVLSSTVAGCLDRFETPPRDVHVELHNGADETRTFHLTLEHENGAIDWHSYTLDGGTVEQIELTAPEGSPPVAVHGAVDEFVDQIRLRGVEDGDEDTCLWIELWYQINEGVSTQFVQAADNSMCNDESKA